MSSQKHREKDVADMTNSCVSLALMGTYRRVTTACSIARSLKCAQLATLIVFSGGERSSRRWPGVSSSRPRATAGGPAAMGAPSVMPKASRPLKKRSGLSYENWSLVQNMPTRILSCTRKTKIPMEKAKAPAERRNKRLEPRRISGRHCTSRSTAAREPAPASHAAPSHARKPTLRASRDLAGCVRQAAAASSRVACVLRTKTTSRLLSRGGEKPCRPASSTRSWQACPQ
mmetsp:Transcript_32544/g.96657  ORF Transcript_32544/g.96657 Transcript_32544/m.96657 type:complete len:230 (-) Transcript_32544:224-913(-)